MIITIKEILSKKVSFFKDAINSVNVYYEDCLSDFLIKKQLKYKDKVLELREINKTDEDKAKKIKLSTFLCCTISSTFDKHRWTYCSKEKTGLIAIDIDKEENPFMNIEQAKRDVIRLPYVSLTMLSVRGEGIWCLIPYNKENNIGDVYRALEEDFKSIGYITDRKCKDITRLRVISYDDNILINEKVEVYEKVKKLEEKEYYEREDWKLTKDDIKDIVNIIYVLVNHNGYQANDYDEWLYEGFRLAVIPNYEVGLQLFNMISSKSENYKGIEDVEEKFKECRRTTDNKTNVLGYYFNEIKRIYGPDWRFRINGFLPKK